MSLTLASARDASLTTLAPLRAQVAFDGGAAGGVLKGDVAADSLILTLAPVADAAPPARPLRLPGPRSRFEATLRFGAAPDAQTRFDGWLGPLPFRGSVQSRQAVPSPAWKSSGEITLAAVTLDSLKSLLPAEALAPLKAYALGGRCEGGTFRFQNRPTGDSLDYTFTTRITGMASTAIWPTCWPWWNGLRSASGSASARSAPSRSSARKKAGCTACQPARSRSTRSAPLTRWLTSSAGSRASSSWASPTR